jgi:hypothetical protein
METSLWWRSLYDKGACAPTGRHLKKLNISCQYLWFSKN